MSTNHKLASMISAAANRAIKQIAALDDEGVEELSNYQGGTGLPLALEIEIGGRGAVRAIHAQPGHYDGSEWHCIDGLLEAVRAGDVAQANALIVNSIEIAIDNERDAQAVAKVEW